MIELPEVVTFTAQMRERLVGQTFAQVEISEERPKWLFIAPDPAPFADGVAGRTIEDVTSRGKWIFLRLDSGETLLLGEFGGRLQVFGKDEELPKKRHITFTFTDGGMLVLAIQMWGFIGLLTEDEVATHPYAGTLGPSPIDPDFTLERWNGVLDTYLESENKPIKAFLTHERNVCGLGNGYLQDILFRANLNPKRKVATLAAEDRTALYHALRETLEEAIDLGGRDTERTLLGEPGGYVPVLDKRAKGEPCPRCGTPIEKIQYLGGSCYVCPSCQPAG